ncbi:thermonuclease family protein [Galactobacter sp.]|uniref:thermonuclease family protein n=1 Tax=Galactobacter sp. TaxID=2676125 RepID=UPI0025C2C89C|nr:thermonuclease family protein [Galactobacter sp.]
MGKLAIGIATTAVVGIVAVGGTAYAVNVSHKNDPHRAVVVNIVDGDTFDAKVQGETTRIRMLNIDAAETKKTTKVAECYAAEATEKLESFLKEGDVVRLEFDKQKKDESGRTLAGVYEDDTFINAEIARQGLGLAVKHEPNVKFYPEVLAAEKEAREAQRGIFSEDATPVADDGAPCSLQVVVRDAEDETNAVIGLGPGETSADTAHQVERIGSALVVAVAADRLVRDGDDHQRRLIRQATGSALVVPASTAVDQLKNKQKRMSAVQKKQEEAETAERERIKKEKEAEKKRQAEAKAKREAEKRAAAQLKAQQEAAAQRQAQQQAAAQRQAQEQAAAQRRQTHSSSGGSGSSGSGGPAGYNGPRCYAPGGKSWKPC